VAIFLHENKILVYCNICASFEVGITKCVPFSEKATDVGIIPAHNELVTCMTKEDIAKNKPLHPLGMSHCSYPAKQCWYPCSLDHGNFYGNKIVDACRCDPPKTCPYANSDHPYSALGPPGGFKYAPFGTRVCLRHPNRAIYKWGWNYCLDPNDPRDVDINDQRCFQSWANCLHTCTSLEYYRSTSTNRFKWLPENCECTPGEDPQTVTNGKNCFHFNPTYCGFFGSLCCDRLNFFRHILRTNFSIFSNFKKFSVLHEIWYILIQKLKNASFCMKFGSCANY